MKTVSGGSMPLIVSVACDPNEVSRCFRTVFAAGIPDKETPCVRSSLFQRCFYRDMRCSKTDAARIASNQLLLANGWGSSNAVPVIGRWLPASVILALRRELEDKCSVRTLVGKGRDRALAPPTQIVPKNLNSEWSASFQDAINSDNAAADPVKWDFVMQMEFNDIVRSIEYGFEDPLMGCAKVSGRVGKDLLGSNDSSSTTDHSRGMNKWIQHRNENCGIDCAKLLCDTIRDTMAQFDCRLSCQRLSARQIILAVDASAAADHSASQELPELAKFIGSEVEDESERNRHPHHRHNNPDYPSDAYFDNTDYDGILDSDYRGRIRQNLAVRSLPISLLYTLMAIIVISYSMEF